MKVVFFIINYKSDNELIDFVQSIANVEKSDVLAEVNVFDNSQKNTKELEQLNDKLNKIYATNLQSTGGNLGYFGCLPMAQKLVSDDDCVIYCNADLQLENDFFTAIGKNVTKNNKVIIAPSIISIDNGSFLNPQIINRVSRRTILRLRAIYSYLITFNLYYLLGEIKEKYFKTKRNDIKAQKIYAPHGAMFIFTDIEFFKNLPHYPCFLFGEELFIAEEARLNNVPISYEPSIKIKDIRHASVSALSNEFKRSLHHKSMCYLLDKYYQ